MKILVTGGTGMVGSTFKEVDSKHQFILVGSKDYDLSRYDESVEMIKDHDPDAMIHLAARLGGVKGNSDFVADFYSQNIRINANVLDAAYQLGVKKVLSLLSTCIYPDQASYPLTEEQIHNGPPHDSNFGYAYAKRMLEVQSRALRQQHGCNFICAVPNNLYGPSDNFDLENGHATPSIIRKIWEAKQSGIPPVFWGDGSSLREFTYAPDVVKILLLVLEKYESPIPINVGSTEERSIRSIVDLVCKYFSYDGKVIWDSNMPSGQFKKPSSNEKLINLGWKNSNFTKFEEGLKQTCNWFMENYPNVRGVS